MSPRERRQRHQRGSALRLAAVVAACVAALAIVAGVAFLALRNSPVFEITSIEVEPTEHVSVSDVQSLAQVPAGSTLLNVDTASLEASLRKNPWVGSVSFERVFPNTLRVSITEQRADMLVVMSSGSVAWYLGDAGTWIQPTRIEAGEGQSVNDAALEKARADGCLLVIDVPSTVDPHAGSEATDAVLESVREFREGFSDDFAARIVCFSASSTDDIWCMLDNGVEVSLGSATDIGEKERIVTDYLEQYPDTALYIVVRVPSSPSVRTIDSDTVQPGDGVGTGFDVMGVTDEETGGASGDGTGGTDGTDADASSADGTDGGSTDGTDTGSAGADATSTGDGAGA